MKKTIRGLCLLFLMFIVVGLCPADTAAAANKILGLDITMSDPALGEKPADTVTVNGSTGAEFAGIQWYGEFDRNGGFKANEVYSARIDFKIPDTLKDKVFVTIEPENMLINGESGAYGQIGCEKSEDGKRVSICYIFPYYFTESGEKKPIEYLNMAECTLEIPEVGKKPATAEQVLMNEGSSLYVENIEWTGGLDSLGRFVAGKDYTAKISLKIKPEDTTAVAAHPALFEKYLKVNGNASDKLEWFYSCDQLILYYTFTAKEKVTSITEVNNVKLTITEPVVGELPRYDAKVADGWKSYVSHSEWSGNFDEYGRFQAGEEYTFTVTTCVMPTEGHFVYDYMGNHILNNKLITKREVSKDGKEITISYTFPALSGTATPLSMTPVDDFEPGDYGVMDMKRTDAVVYLYDGMDADKELYAIEKNVTLLVLSAYVKDNWCAVLYDGKLLYVQHSDLFSNRVKYGNSPVEAYGNAWTTAEKITGCKPIHLVGDFYINAKVNQEPVVKDDYWKDDDQYYMSDMSWNYEGPLQPYTWAEFVITCKAKEGYYFAHNVKTDYTFVYMPDEVHYIDKDTVQLVYYKWIDGSSVDIGVTKEMEKYNEMHPIGHFNSTPVFGTAMLYQPVEVRMYDVNDGSTKFYTYPAGTKTSSFERLNTSAKITILDYDLTDEIPEMTGEWCRIIFGGKVGFVPKACLTDVVLTDFWEGAPAKLHDSPYKFAGGSGTRNDPFLIATAEQLDAVRKNLTAHYKLIADIDLSQWGNWVPIGATPAFGAGTDSANKAQFGGGAFMGSFDGNGHIISGMTIVVNEEKPYMQEKGNSRFYGLFGITGGAEIKNLGLVNYNIDINYTGVTENLMMWAGAFSGWFNCNNEKNTYDVAGNMENCYADGGKISITANVAEGAAANISIEVGGLVGEASLGKINRCYNGSDITVKCNSPFYLVGAGICATMCNTWITECYNTGNISLPLGDVHTFWRDSMAGGLVGEIGPNGIESTMNKPKENASCIWNCYNTGHLTAATVAGIYVYNNSLAAGYAENCYNIGKLTCSEFPIDGYSLFGKADIISSFASCCNSTYMKNCYADGNKVSGSAWQKSSSLGRMVLKAIPEDASVIPEVDVTPETITIQYPEPIQWAIDNKLIPTPSEDYSLDEVCTRAEFFTYLWRLEGAPKATDPSPYVDVKEGNEYYDVAIWAYNKGLVTIKIFATKTMLCKRSESMLYLWQYAGSPEGFTCKYYDVTSNKYRVAVGWAVENDIITPEKSGKFGSINTCTREEIITFIYRALKK